MSTPFSLNIFKIALNLNVEWHTVNRLIILRVQNRNFRGFGLFKIVFKRRNFPSARCALAPNAIGSDIGTFSGSSVSINDLIDFDTFTR
jgi:hypothetical protein